MNLRGGKKEEKLLKNRSVFSEPVITARLLWEGKKVLVLPPEIRGYASMPKWMTGPFLISTKSSLVVLHFFPPLSHTVWNSKVFRSIPLYLGLRHLSSFSQKRTQLRCPKLLKWLIYVSNHLTQFSQAGSCTKDDLLSCFLILFFALSDYHMTNYQS